MKYFFQLGSNPKLSLGEFFSVLKENSSKTILLNNNILILKSENKINAPDLINKMGGIVKIGIIKNEIKTKRHLDEFIKKIDLNKDGTYDLIIRLNALIFSILNGKDNFSGTDLTNV